MVTTGTAKGSQKRPKGAERVQPDSGSSACADRLEIDLPEFTRYTWVSDSARQQWEPEVQRISRAWTEIEWRSVSEQIRACALQSVSPELLPDYSAQLAQFGLSVLPLAREAAVDRPYSSVPEPPEGGKPFSFRVAVGKVDTLARFQGFWEGNDHRALGSLLGYPPCCCSFFERVWIRDKWIDTTWPMALNTEEGESTKAIAQLSGPPEANILLRWLGIRSVFHLPCSFHCASTVEVGRTFVKLGRELGYEAEMNRLMEMLSWSVEWSAIHGIAEVKTPVVKITTRTDGTPGKLTVRRRGEGYPQEGAEGIRFPYEPPQRRPLTSSPSFQRGLTHQSESDKTPSWLFKDNGFDSLSAMKTAHSSIVQAISQVVGEEQEESVLDLGCGNGALLQAVSRSSSNISPFGVEQNQAAIEHARRLLPDNKGHFYCGDMFELEMSWSGQCYSITLLMPGRILETGDREAERLRSWLNRSSARLLLYAYGDWLQREGGLAPLARKAGFLPLKAAGPSVLWAKTHQGG